MRSQYCNKRQRRPEVLRVDECIEAGIERQQFTGDRSIGTPDPGIVAIATMMNDICAAVGVAPKATKTN